ncbi:hypothetical protein C0J52_11971 [Blattella germanica]|nr:hypothetical protein C0J52_11971 [Blattella germanica]
MNQAHQLERRAELHLERKDFDEAIQCYQKAVQKLKEAEQKSNDKKFIQSVKYQQESMKKTQYFNYKAKQQNMIQELTKLEQTSDKRTQDANILRDQIKRAMEEADSLIYLLRHRTDSEGEELKSLKDENTEDMHKTDAVKLEGNKWPKDDSTVLEELQTINLHQRSLVDQLTNQLIECTKEIEMLRERVRFLEGERRMKSDDVEMRGFMPVIRKDNLKVNTDSNGGSSSFECSPCSELSPDIPPEIALVVPSRELPILAPLEMPSFDWTMFSKKPETETAEIDKSPSS